MLVCLGAFSLSKNFEVVDVAVECLPHRVHIVVLDPKFLTSLAHYGSDEGIVGLDDAREEVVCGLVVECSCEHVPEPAVCGIVLSRGNL